MIQLDSISEVGDDDDRDASFSIPSLWCFDQAKCRAALARMIIVDELPFLLLSMRDFVISIKY